MASGPGLRPREAWALVAALLAAAAVTVLPWMSPVDALAARFLQVHGGSGPHAAARWLDDGARTSLFVLAVVTIIAGRIRGRELAAAFATIGIGALVGEVLKTAIER